VAAKTSDVTGRFEYKQNTQVILSIHWTAGELRRDLESSAPRDFSRIWQESTLADQFRESMAANRQAATLLDELSYSKITGAPLFIRFGHRLS
jgi:hypothetical protein